LRREAKGERSKVKGFRDRGSGPDRIPPRNSRECFQEAQGLSYLRLPSNYAVLLIAAAVLMAVPALQASAEEYRSPSDGIQSMNYEDGRLSLEAQDASLDKVLTELARMAMITIVADGPIQDRVTAYADRLPLEKALKRVLRGKDTSFVYAARDEGSPTEYDIVEVRIYLANEDKGEARRYSYTKREEKKKAPKPPRSRTEVSRKQSAPVWPTAVRPPTSDLATAEEGQRILSELMQGDLEGLDKLVEKLKDQNPQVQEQVDQFLESLDEIRAKAEERGQPLPSFEGLGDMQSLMDQMLEDGRMAPDQERE
jgi:hypothetical protein